jgi:hypothetical protein
MDARFLLERDEYRDPATHGWRIRFRRIFLVKTTTKNFFLED